MPRASTSKIQKWISWRKEKNNQTVLHADLDAKEKELRLRHGSGELCLSFEILGKEQWVCLELEKLRREGKCTKFCWRKVPCPTGFLHLLSLGSSDAAYLLKVKSTWRRVNVFRYKRLLIVEISLRTTRSELNIDVRMNKRTIWTSILLGAVSEPMATMFIKRLCASFFLLQPSAKTSATWGNAIQVSFDHYKECPRSSTAIANKFTKNWVLFLPPRG